MLVRSPTCLEKLKFSFKKITPIPEVTLVQTLLQLMECLLVPENTPPDSHKEIYELYFVFACIWAFGGAMFQDQVHTHATHATHTRYTHMPHTSHC